MILNSIYLLFFFIILVSLPLQACNNSDGEEIKLSDNKTSADISDSDKKDSVIPFSLNHKEIKYKLVVLKNRETINNILNKYKDTPLHSAYRKTLRTLNRKELRFFSVGQSVIVPDTIIDDIRAYSIFPDEYIGARDIDKIIIIDNAYQAYACYEYGKLVRFAATNTGKETTPTFPGRYSLIWKQRVRHSSLDSTWIMPYTVNFHQYAGNAMHEFIMPGRPVSHSCVRQFPDDAEWIYKWGSLAKYDENKKPIPFSGTPLIVLNVFDYSRKKGGPWLDLHSNKSYYVQLPPNPLEVEEALIPWVQIPKAARGGIVDKNRFIYAEDTLRARGVIRPGVKLKETVDFNKLRRAKKAEELLKEQEKNSMKTEENNVISK